jgi:hypothetical protein
MIKLLSSLFIRKTLTVILAVVAIFFSSSQVTFAQLPEHNSAVDGPIQNFAIPENLTNYEDAKSGASLAFYMVYIWRALLFVGALMVIIYFIMGAFEWMSAQGEGSKISAARNKMTGAIAGFIVLAAMFAIIEFISAVFNINILQPSIPVPTGTTTTTTP